MLEGLVGRLGDADWRRRLDLLCDFTEWWQGPLTVRESNIPLPEGPDALRGFHERFHHAPFVPGAQNEFLCPPYALAEPRRIVFYRENQGVYYWATEPAGQDPPVYGAWDIAGPWTEEQPRLSAFLVQAALFETILGAECSVAAAWVPAEALRQLLGTLQEVPLGAWRWPSYPTRFYAGGEVLLVVCPNDDSFSVWAAARRPGVPRPRGFETVEWDSLNWDDAAV